MDLSDLGEGVCMPHAKPETGVLSTGLCIIKLNTPVDFEGKKCAYFLRWRPGIGGSFCADEADSGNVRKRRA